jgi:hypothetical protein
VTDTNTACWLRVFDLAPDLMELIKKGKLGELSADHALLLALLRPAARQQVLKKSKEAWLWACAGMVAFHKTDHDERDVEEQLYCLREECANEDPDDRLDTIQSYIDRDPDNIDDDRDIDAIVACEDCKAWWPTAPQRDRERRAASAGQFYGASPTNGRRRTKAEIEQIKNAIYRVVSEGQPMTLRQIFYRLVALGAVEKTESEYDSTVGRLLLQMRRAGEVPYDWIADNTRWIRKPDTFSSIEHALRYTAQHYRRDVWHELNVHVEVYCEKDALAGVLAEETEPYDVPLMVFRGFSSESYLHTVAEEMLKHRKPTWIYYFGDHDPSGRLIPMDVERKLRGFAPGCEIHFERVAVNEDQIVDMRLPTRPTKREGNSHAKSFKGDSVELDAIPATTLRTMLRQCIERHIPAGHVEALEIAERSEREIFTRIAGAARGTGEAK